MLRREFLKLIGFTVLSIGTGIGFAGCSGSSSSGGGFEPSNPVSTGYKLIYPDWTKEVPDDVIPHIIEIGRKCIEVYAPVSGSIVFTTNMGDVDIHGVTPNMIIKAHGTLNPRVTWIIGDDNVSYEGEKYIYEKVYREEFGRNLGKFVYFVANNMGYEIGAIVIVGKVGDMGIANYTFIAEGGGTVASCVATLDPNNCEFYAFHSKDKLDEMMIEMLSNFEGYKNYFKDFRFTHPEKWRDLPDIVAKCGGSKWNCDEFRKIATW